MGIAISRDDRYITAGTTRGVVCIWEFSYEGLRLVGRLLGHSCFILGVVFTPSGKGLVSWSRDQVKVWDITTLNSTSALPGAIPNSANTFESLSKCTSTSFTVSHGSIFTVSCDGQWVVSASGDRVWFWDAQTSRTQLMLLGHNDSVHSIALSPQGNLLATASKDGRSKLWKYSTNS